MDATGRQVFSSGVLDAAGGLPQGSRVFHQVFADQGGNVLVRHEIWRVQKIISDSRIPSRGSRLEQFRLPKSVVLVGLRLLWRDVPAEFSAWVLQQSANRVPVQTILEQTVGL